MRILSILLISLLLIACATDNYYVGALNSWRGNHLGNLLKTWGAPDQVITIPSGNTYYIYQSQSVQSAPGPYVPGFFTYNNTSNNKPMVGAIMMPSPPSLYVLTCRTWFEVDKTNTIVDAGAKGNYCYAGNDSVQNIASPSYHLSTVN
jgi:hypothetical protein